MAEDKLLDDTERAFRCGYDDGWSTGTAAMEADRAYSVDADWQRYRAADQHTLSQFRYTELAHNALAELEPRLERYHAALEDARDLLRQAVDSLEDLGHADVAQHYRTALGQTDL